MTSHRTLVALLTAALAGCGGNAADAAPGNAERSVDAPGGFEPPVVTNAESPVRYPPDLFRQQVEGTVVLRLYITAEGDLVADSTRVAESSGHARLDSAAVEGVAAMAFAPARRDGTPVATAFLQPVHFRHPAGASAGGEQ